MSEQIALFDWQHTSIGPRSNWPVILRLMIDVALSTRFPMLIWWGPELLQIYNDAYVPLLGARHPSALGQAAEDCWPEIWDTVGPMIHGTLNTGESVWGEDMPFELERNGYREQAYFTFSYSRIQGEGSHERGVLCTNVETTKSVTRELEFRATADNLANIIFTHAPDGSIEWANARWFEYSQLPMAIAIKPEGWKLVLPQVDFELILQKIEQAFCEGKPYEAEIRFKPYGSEDDSYRWHLVRAVPMRDQNGTIFRWAGSATDVHERRTAVEARLRDIQSIADAVPQLIWTTTADAKIETVSERFATFTGLSAESAKGYGWASLVPAEEHEAIFKIFSEGVRTGSSVSFYYNLWHAESRTYRAMLARANPSLDASGKVIGWIGTSTDMDEERRESERDHRISEAFQMASLPHALPNVPGLHFSADYHAAGTGSLVGGDWYDAFELNDGRIIVSVGDVIGSGLDSAVAMAAMRQAIRGSAQIYPDPIAVLDAADRTLHSEQPDRIVTAFLGVYEPITGFFTYASAGHPSPILRRADFSIVELTGSGLPLGLRSEFPAIDDVSRSVQLTDRSLLILYTDGLTEATRDTAVGESRLWEAAAGIDIETGGNLAQRIRRLVLHSQPMDDVAILTLALHGPINSGQLRWIFDANQSERATIVRDELCAVLRERNVDNTSIHDTEIIFSELMGNVVRHTSGTVEVALDMNHQYPVMHILDRGPGFSFAARLPRDMMSESGRGLFIAAKLARDLNVSPRPDGGSHARAVLAFPIARSQSNVSDSLAHNR